MQLIYSCLSIFFLTRLAAYLLLPVYIFLNQACSLSTLACLYFSLPGLQLVYSCLSIFCLYFSQQGLQLVYSCLSIFCLYFSQPGMQLVYSCLSIFCLYFSQQGLQLVYSCLSIFCLCFYSTRHAACLLILSMFCLYFSQQGLQLVYSCLSIFCLYFYSTRHAACLLLPVYILSIFLLNQACSLSTLACLYFVYVFFQQGLQLVYSCLSIFFSTRLAACLLLPVYILSMFLLNQACSLSTLACQYITSRELEILL